MSLGARTQAALGIRLQEPTAAPHQQKQSVRVGYSPVKGQAEQRCAGLLMCREGGPASKKAEVAAMTLTDPPLCFPPETQRKAELQLLQAASHLGRL